ncbi:MAG: tetratricopeptide repeat protein [Chloroflexota bacterium]
MSDQDMLQFMPLDLDIFSEGERFRTGTRLGAAFSEGIRAYSRAAYSDAIEHFRAALIAAYVEGEEQDRIYARERAMIYLYIGNALALQDKWDASLHEYMEAIHIYPHLIEAHYNVGVALAAQRKIHRAIAAFQETLQHNANFYEAQFSVGRCYQNLGKTRRAYIHYQHASRIRPDAAEPLYYMGDIHQSQGGHGLAQKYFTQAIQTEPTFVLPREQQNTIVSVPKGKQIQWYYHLCDDLKAHNYQEEAEHLYRSLLQLHPHEHTARYLLGNLLARKHHFYLAYAEYACIPPQNTHYLDTRIRMSTILKLQKKRREAYKLLFDCAVLFPKNGHIFLHMGKLLYEMDKIPVAIRAFERSVQLLPDNVQAYYLLGYLYTAHGFHLRAITVWEKAVDLAPDMHSLRYDLGILYFQNNQHSLAAEAFDHVLQYWQDDTSTTFMLGLCYKELQETARAIPLFENILLHNPRHTLALYYLGAMYMKMGNVSLGKAYLRRYDYLNDKSHLGSTNGSSLNSNEELATNVKYMAV